MSHCRWKKEYSTECTLKGTCKYKDVNCNCTAPEVKSLKGHICMWSDAEGQCNEEMHKTCPELKYGVIRCPYISTICLLSMGAYERFRLSIGGRCLSDWQTLPEETKKAWEVATVHIREETRKE